MADPYLFEIYPESGYATLFMSCFDLMSGAFDGVNSAGLTVALLADLDPREAGSLEPATPATDRRSSIVKMRLCVSRTIS